MANPSYQPISATGQSTPTVLNFLQSPFNVSYAVEVLGGATASFGVQFTLDDVQLVDTAQVTWFNDPNNPSGVTTSVVGNFAFPVRAVCVNVASLSGGTLLFAVLQGMNGIV